jgi:glycosyltransferase involved in cell wall biosynthesis
MQITVSLIVCCYNENDYIDRCLDSLLSQKNIPEPFEILVIDGMSADGTREKILAKQKVHSEIRFLIILPELNLRQSIWVSENQKASISSYAMLMHTMMKITFLLAYN